MQIKFSHVKIGSVNAAVFGADAVTRLDKDRGILLADLTKHARTNGLRVDRSALMWRQGGRIRFYGDRQLVRYLESNWPNLPWNHKISY